jgi:hypothetical protein
LARTLTFASGAGLPWVALVALVLATAGCGPSLSDASTVPATLGPDAVVLLTARQGGVGCPANFVDGELVFDAAAGSAIIDAAGIRKPITWPYGYTGRRRDAEVEILDRTGSMVARSGTRIRLPGGEIVPGTWFACPGPRVIR